MNQAYIERLGINTDTFWIIGVHKFIRLTGFIICVLDAATLLNFLVSPMCKKLLDYFFSRRVDIISDIDIHASI
ncbi:hypothetical protein D3C76_1680280 [compost metagenome]